MLRSLLRLGGAVALLCVLAPAEPSAAPALGLSYDEIVRIVVDASPPPPGNFQADLTALTAATPVPSAAPKRRGIGLGSIAGAVLGGGGVGDIAGSVASDAAANAIDNAMEAQLGAQFGALAASLRSFLDPHHLRYAFYNGWERVDDVTAQTATIRKCDLGQVVTLDLAKSTYRVFDPNSEPTPSAAPPPSRSQRQRPDAPSAPGTAVLSLTSTTKALGPLRIDNRPTNGYDSTASIAMTQATGSCRNGSAAVTTTEYLSALTQPSVTSCPLRRAPVPESASDVVAPTQTSGGCRPTVAFHQSGSPPPADKLALYSLVSMNAASGATPAPAASGTGGGIGFLTERGNLRALQAGDASLFEIPPGFTKVP